MHLFSWSVDCFSFSLEQKDCHWNINEGQDQVLREMPLDQLILNGSFSEHEMVIHVPAILPDGAMIAGMVVMESEGRSDVQMRPMQDWSLHRIQAPGTSHRILLIAAHDPPSTRRDRFREED